MVRPVSIGPGYGFSRVHDVILQPPELQHWIHKSSCQILAGTCLVLNPLSRHRMPPTCAETVSPHAQDLQSNLSIRQPVRDNRRGHGNRCQRMVTNEQDMLHRHSAGVPPFFCFCCFFCLGGQSGGFSGSRFFHFFLLKVRKILAHIRVKSALPLPPSKTQKTPPPPLRRGALWAGLFPAERRILSRRP